MVDGFGISDSVSILPPGAATITVSHSITNAGTGAVSGSYIATDSVVRWVFQGGPTVGYGWVPGPASSYTVPTSPATGPPLGAGATATIAFPPFAIPSGCGLYSETLTIDAGATVSESNEADNVDSTTHLFFVPSTQQFNITVNEINSSIGHLQVDPPTHQFIVTPAGAPGWIFAGFSFTATEGSRAYTVPAPPIPAGPGPQVITMHVRPRQHALSGGGTVTGKVTVISADGCVLKQQSATVFVEH
jgi:hypothetical protein